MTYKIDKIEKDKFKAEITLNDEETNYKLDVYFMIIRLGIGCITTAVKVSSFLDTSKHNKIVVYKDDKEIKVEELPEKFINYFESIRAELNKNIFENII